MDIIGLSSLTDGLSCRLHFHSRDPLIRPTLGFTDTVSDTSQPASHGP